MIILFNIKNHLPYLSLSDICKDLYLSNATIVRFCQKLGFKGFNELKFTLRNELHSSSDFSNSWKILQRRTAVLKDFIDNIDAVKIKRHLLGDHAEQIYLYLWT